MANKDLVRYICAVLTITMLAIPVSCAAPEQKPGGEFEVVSLNVIPSEVSIGEEAIVTAKIVNIGESKSNYTAVLLINDVEFERKDAVIPAQDTAIVTFSLTKYEAGAYRLAIDGSTASLSVSDPMQTIRATWQTFEPLASLGLTFWKLIVNKNLSDIGQLTSSKYEEQRAADLINMDDYLDRIGNQELREKWTILPSGTPTVNGWKLYAEFSDLYIDSLEAATDSLQSSLSTEQKSTAQQELRTEWESIEPLAQIEILVAENLRDWYLLEAEEITQSDYYTRTTYVSEKINASLDKLGNKDFTQKFTTAWFKPSGVEKAKLWSEFINLYGSLFDQEMKDFSQKLGQ